MKLDLHGLPIHNAWTIFNDKITDAYYMKYKYIIVVTGQGEIMQEFRHWVSNHPHTKSCNSTPYNPGSFKVVLK
tara:strand:+ start:1339 stop:1560 length:222 start_codon:yes stop_codon:yes gene_type:complete